VTIADAQVQPVLVLGLGNQLLGDDAIGLVLADAVRRAKSADARIEVVDGGTQGLALLGRLDGRRGVLLLDAFSDGSKPGTVHCVADPLEAAAARAFGAHGSTAGELLAAARMTGVLPDACVLVGVEPAVVQTRIGLSAPVRGALPEALVVALRILERLAGEPQPCTS